MTTKYAGLAGDAYGAADDPRPPLVLLHGLTFDRRIWAPAIAALKALDPSRRIVAFDLPGHGESEALDAYRLPIVAERLHAAVEASGSSRPVFVGHSISGVIATIYAASYPVSGVVNVDQTLAVRPFAELVRSLAPQLKGSEFQQVWTRFRESWHAEKLPPAGERLVDETSNPRQNVVLGYWEDLFEQSPEALESWASDVVGRLRPAGLIAISKHRRCPWRSSWCCRTAATSPTSPTRGDSPTCSSRPSGGRSGADSSRSLEPRGGGPPGGPPPPRRGIGPQGRTA